MLDLWNTNNSLAFRKLLKIKILLDVLIKKGKKYSCNIKLRKCLLMTSTESAKKAVTELFSVFCITKHARGVRFLEGYIGKER